MPKSNNVLSVATVSLPNSPMSTHDVGASPNVLADLLQEKLTLTARIKEIEKVEKKLTGAAIDALAKRLVYHAFKTTPAIRDDIYNKLRSVGLAKTNKNGTPAIPWRLVKAYTDDIYDNMTPEAKAPYIAEATATLAKK